LIDYRAQRDPLFLTMRVKLMVRNMS
jgi:hypothetical protein